MDANPCVKCGYHCHAGLPTSDLPSIFGPVMESLRSDLKEFFTSRLEEVLSPLKVEASTIKLWLARVANYLEHVDQLI